MLNDNFVYLALVLNSIGGISYLIYTLQGKVKPNKVTWFLWGVIPMIAFAAQIKEGVGLQSLLTFAIGFIPILIFLGSYINKNAYWRITRLDIICGIFSVLGVAFWLITGQGIIAILFSLFADGIAGIPTLVKSIKEPETENYVAYLLTTIASVITILTIKEWNFATFSFPIYILIINGLLAFLIWSKFGKKLNTKK